MASTYPSAAPARLPPSVPSHHLDKDKNQSTLRIGAWTIQAIKKPILNVAEVDR